MPLFPACLDLSVGTVLIVGSGETAKRRAGQMAPFCPKVVCCDYPPRWEEVPALVLLTEQHHPENEFWAAEFRSMGVPVNVSDRPELCSFRFPSLIVRGDVSIGLATDGKAPALGALLRETIEAALPEDLEAITQAAAQLTAELRKTVPDQKERARLIRQELEKLLGDPFVPGL